MNMMRNTCLLPNSHGVPLRFNEGNSNTDAKKGICMVVSIDKNNEDIIRHTLRYLLFTYLSCPATPPSLSQLFIVMISCMLFRLQNACKTIIERLEPIVQKNPKGTWEEWIKAAYMERIGLSASGFYRTPDIGYSFETNTGKAFNYFVYGVACSEVEIDCLTGDHQVLRTDIVMDLGTHAQFCFVNRCVKVDSF